MSDFEPSPRSSKRRKIATFTATDSTKAKRSPSTRHSINQVAGSISRRLFESRDGEDELAQGDRSTNVQDSTYGSKEDSQDEEGTASAVTVQLAEVNPGDSESADELAQAEVTVTPTKSQRKGLRQKGKTQNSGEKAPRTAGGIVRTHYQENKAEGTRIGTRSSARERKRSRRLSSSWEETSRPTTPKGILTPSRKADTSRRKSVAFEQDGAGVEEALGFKDLDKIVEKKTEKTRRPKEPYHGDEAEGQVSKDIQKIRQGPVIDENPRQSKIQTESVPDVPELPELATIPSIEHSSALADSRFDAARSLILSRLTGQILTPLTTLEAEYSKLHSLLSATIKAGEGNSILLLGSRGVGKTCLVETAIADLVTEHAAEFHVVRLNGFFQTDDKLALREIWRQLGREMQIEEDETSQVNTYADTMASLLHLLSHPEELAETHKPDAPASTTKSVVFVLDEFDLFTTHPRQTLLYNLFDIAQARKAPIAVVGCCARVDVSDNLEKRVKSRFSHRWVHLSQAKSFPAFEEIAKAALMLREHDKYHEKQSISTKIRVEWNTFIEVRGHMMEEGYDVSADLDVLYIDVATINGLDQAAVRPAPLSYLQPPDSVLNMLPHFPPLHLSLLISTARLDAIHNASVVTFALVYSHYVDLVSRARLQASAAGSIAQATKLWNHDVAAAAWEELAEWEIILPAAGKGTEQEQAKMWRCDVVLEEIIEAVGGADAGMSDVMIRWCKEI